MSQMRHKPFTLSALDMRMVEGARIVSQLRQVHGRNKSRRGVHPGHGSNRSGEQCVYAVVATTVSYTGVCASASSVTMPGTQTQANQHKAKGPRRLVSLMGS